MSDIDLEELRRAIADLYVTQPRRTGFMARLADLVEAANLTDGEIEQARLRLRARVKPRTGPAPYRFRIKH